MVEESQAWRWLHRTELQHLGGPLTFSGVEAVEIELCVVSTALGTSERSNDIVLLTKAVVARVTFNTAAHNANQTMELVMLQEGPGCGSRVSDGRPSILERGAQ